MAQQKRRTHFELRAAMRWLGIDQSQLGKACDVNRITTWRWLNGKKNIPGYVWSILGLLDEEEPDDPEMVMMGMPKEWPIEYEDVFDEGETYRELVKKWHPDKTGRDTSEEMSVISEFKNW